MVRKISDICEKLNDTLLERRIKKLSDLREGGDVSSAVSNDIVVDHGLRDEGGNVTDQITREPSREEIGNFIANIKEDVSNRGDVGENSGVVVIEDLTPEETLAGVNPLPVDCPLLLIDVRGIESDIDSVLSAARGVMKDKVW